MARVFFTTGKQKDFLEKVKDKTGLDWDEIARLCGICRRSLINWKREKLHASLKAVRKLEKVSGVKALHIEKIKREHWQIANKEMARRGGLARYRKYGNPGTTKGRKKGGLKTVERKPIFLPSKSPELTEFIGILLGDGSITRGQIAIYFNSEDDYKYSRFVYKLIKQLFKISPGEWERRDCKVLVFCISSVILVEFLENLGLKKGNKVKQQVAIPGWIMRDLDYAKTCLRGLMDTDGSVFEEKHSCNGEVYIYKVLTLTNYSRPIIRQSQEILNRLGFRYNINNDKRLNIRSQGQIERYFKEIGTHNPKHLRRFLN